MSVPPVNTDHVAEALWGTLESTNELDSNFESANVVDGLFMISRALSRIAKTLEVAQDRKDES